MNDLPSQSQIMRITVITDPKNPDESLFEQVVSYGEILAKVECSDGFVLLVKCRDDVVFPQ